MPVTRTSDALEERRDRVGRAELAHEVDFADVDAQFERRGGDNGFRSSPDFSRRFLRRVGVRREPGYRDAR